MKCRSVRARPGGGVLSGKKKVDIKHLVMTGKEHRLPQAGFFSLPPPHFKHVPITFFYFRKRKHKLLV